MPCERCSTWQAALQTHPAQGPGWEAVDGCGAVGVRGMPGARPSLSRAAGHVALPLAALGPFGMGMRSSVGLRDVCVRGLAGQISAVLMNHWAWVAFAQELEGPAGQQRWPL